MGPAAGSRLDHPNARSEERRRQRSMRHKRQDRTPPCIAGRAGPNALAFRLARFAPRFAHDSAAAEKDSLECECARERRRSARIKFWVAPSRTGRRIPSTRKSGPRARTTCWITLGIGGRKRLVLAFWLADACSGGGGPKPPESERPTHSSKWRMQQRPPPPVKRRRNRRPVERNPDRPRGFVPSAGTSDGI